MIVCLGWGSLIWNPGSLPLKVASNPLWSRNGPCLPIEFARKSQDGRITLVITREAKPIQVFYAVMDVPSIRGNGIDCARQALANREAGKDIPPERIDEFVGHWSANSESDHCEVVVIREWAEQLGHEGVVWTALPSNFEDETKMELNSNNVVSYLKCLRERGKATEAEKYVRLTPAPIRTEIRSEIERELGWMPIDP